MAKSFWQRVRTWWCGEPVADYQHPRLGLVRFDGEWEGWCVDVEGEDAFTIVVGGKKEPDLEELQYAEALAADPAAFVKRARDLLRAEAERVPVFADEIRSLRIG